MCFVTLFRQQVQLILLCPYILFLWNTSVKPHDYAAEGDLGELEPLAAAGYMLWDGSKAGIAQRGALPGAMGLATA